MTRIVQPVYLLSVMFVPFLGSTPLMAATESDDHAERALVPSLSDPTLWWEMLWAVVVFAIFFAVLSTMVWPQVLKALASREQKQRDDLTQAEQARDEAKQTLAQYKAQLAEARKEAQALIEQSRSDAQKVAAELKEQTQGELTRMRQRAESDIRVAKEQALAEIYEQTATLATQVAGRILQREIQADDQQALVEASLAELSRSGQMN